MPNLTVIDSVPAETLVEGDYFRHGVIEGQVISIEETADDTVIITFADANSYDDVDYLTLMWDKRVQLLAADYSDVEV